MKIAYIKTENVKLKDLIEFQGNLKELSTVNFEKLRTSIRKNFTEPFSVWQDTDKKIYILAGHQRYRVLKKMQEQEEEIPESFPCNFIAAVNKHEAKEILLTLASQYGKITDDGLYEFLMDNEMDMKLLNDVFEFPGLDLDTFNDNFFNESIDTDTDTNINGEEPKEKEVDENIEVKNECPRCGYKW